MLLAAAVKTAGLLSVSNLVLSVPKGAKKQAVMWSKQALLFPPGRGSGRFTLGWCDGSSGRRASCQGKVSFVSPQVSVPVAGSRPSVPPSLPPFSARRPTSTPASDRSVSPSTHRTRLNARWWKNTDLTVVLIQLCSFFPLDLRKC